MFGKNCEATDVGDASQRPRTEGPPSVIMHIEIRWVWEYIGRRPLAPSDTINLRMH
jgi:hypothetical protein